MHFYIVAVALSYLALVARNRAAALDWGLGLFVQLGLLAGYSVGVYRLLNEPMSLAAPTMGLSGIIMCAAFALYNFDLYRRFVRPASRLVEQG